MKLSKLQREQKAKLAEELRVAFDNYYRAIEAANNFMNEIASEAQSYYDDRSDQWKDSERASVCEDFISSWEEDLELPDDQAETFEQLPDAPEPV